MPIVSVIVPNFNHSPFLEERIESILSQTFQNFELILLDDASTDTSLEILNQYRNHPKVSHFEVNSKNSGSPFAQWLKGIAVAKGNYIWIAESDDFAATDFLECIIPKMQENREVTLAYSDSTIIDENGNELGLWSKNKNQHFKTDRWSHDYLENGKEEVLDYLLYRTTINNASAVVFRKDILMEPTYTREIVKFRSAGDLYTYIITLCKGQLVYIADPLNNYRHHKENITKSNKGKGILYLDRIKCFEKSLEIILNDELSKHQFKKAQKGYLAVVKKNFFKLLEHNYLSELNVFLKNLRLYNMITFTQYQLLVISIKLYKLKAKPMVKIAKKMMKKI